MKYTTDEALAEIMKRRDQIILRRDRRACRMLSGMVGTLFAVLVLMIAILPGKTGAASTGSVYGSFLLSQEAGGYVLAAVVAFVLGVMVTLLCLKLKNQRWQSNGVEYRQKDDAA